MKLYYAPGVCSLSPHIILRETNTPFTLVKTSIREKSKDTDDGSDFWKVNPNGYVPALLLDDGTILTEGAAIVQYIADKADAEHLAPRNGTIERYRMQSWLSFVSSELHRSFTPLLSPVYSSKLNEETRAAFRDRVAQRLQFLDKHFAENDYLMGQSYTVPDAYCFTILRWTKPVQIDLAPYPNVQAYMDRVGSRPAVQAAIEAEGLAA